MEIKCFKEDLWNIIDKSIKYEVIADGFEFLEGPVWDKKNKRLIFNDIVKEKLYEWSHLLGTRVIKEKNNMANGNAIDKDGNIISCEHKTSRIVSLSPRNNYKILISKYNNLRFNSPNDIAIKSNGDIYFTDPNYGRTKKVGLQRVQELFFQGVYKFNPTSNELILLVDNLKNPNGIVFSKDERKLFISDTMDKSIWMYKLDEKGHISYGELWAKLEGLGVDTPDGLEINEREDLFCATSNGIWIFNKYGEKLGLIKMPTQTTNMAFGNEDLKSLYITISDRLVKLNMKVGKN